MDCSWSGKECIGPQVRFISKLDDVISSLFDRSQPVVIEVFVIRDFCRSIIFLQILFLILKDIDNKILKNATIFWHGKYREYKLHPSSECSCLDKRGNSFLWSVKFCRSVKFSYRQKLNWLPLFFSDQCEARRKAERLKTQSIKLSDVGAIFVVLFFGIGGAGIAFLCEYVVNKIILRRHTLTIQISQGEATGW